MNSYQNETCDFIISEIINIVKIETDSNWYLDNLTTSDHWILSFTLGGEADYYWGGNSYKVKKGDTIFFQEGFSRSAQSSPLNPWKFIVIKFKITNYNSTRKELESIPNISKDIEQRMEPLFMEAETIWRSKRPGFVLRCKGILYSIMYNLMFEAEQFYARSIPYIEQLKHVTKLIHDNINRSYSVKELANIAGLSESYFRKLFKEYTGYSVIQYQNYIKTSYARDLLLSGNYNVTQVAYQVGINDIYYFSRLFKKLTGINPSTLVR